MTTLNHGQRAQAFFAAYEALCREHGISLSHEDGHGAFILHDFDEENIGWVQTAHWGDHSVAGREYARIATAIATRRGIHYSTALYSVLRPLLREHPTADSEELLRLALPQGVGSTNA